MRFLIRVFVKILRAVSEKAFYLFCYIKELQTIELSAHDA